MLQLFIVHRSLIQMQAQSDNKKPHVLIAGGGLAGLFLGILLDKQGVSYEIFEQFSRIDPFGE